MEILPSVGGEEYGCVNCGKCIVGEGFLDVDEVERCPTFLRLSNIFGYSAPSLIISYSKEKKRRKKGGQV